MMPPLSLSGGGGTASAGGSGVGYYDGSGFSVSRGGVGNSCSLGPVLLVGVALVVLYFLKGR